MKKSVYADVRLFESLSGLVDAEGIQIELTKDEVSDVRILMCSDRKECDPDTLYFDGWIACRIALGLAEKLEIPTIQVGALLNHLEIKVKHCSLGCF